MVSKNKTKLIVINRKACEIQRTNVMAARVGISFRFTARTVAVAIIFDAIFNEIAFGLLKFSLKFDLRLVRGKRRRFVLVL